MKRKRILAIVFALIAALSMVFAGCSSQSASTPQDVIKDAYGNQQFKISFNSEGLDAPIADMTYTAESMPALPTPERVGYIFSGWYLDSAYTIPYTDGILYLYMRDVTLYAKWEQETFETDGTYDIDFSANITEITYKGELADEYGWYDFAEAIVGDETYIEKTENGLLLKLQYEAPAIVPFGSSDVYTVTVSSASAATVRLSESITPDNDTVKTLYFNIDEHDLTVPIYFTVSCLNYDDMNMSATDRAKTQVTYTLEFSIDRLIGFSRPFVDASVQLPENTYYLVKTHYVPDDYDGDSMMESYNAVYSYLSVDGDGNYTLIKPFMPYTGLVSNISGTVYDNFTDNFYSRGMTFGATNLYYTIDPPSSLTAEEIEEAEYLPELYNGEYYGSYTVEYHADTGRYYMLYDLGKDLTKQFMINGATTGFMEIYGAMGSYNIVMTLDYEHIIQLADIDYQSLSGDAYVYGSDMQYYAGNLADLNETDMARDAVEDLGLSTMMVNYYYSATSANAPLAQRTMYSHSFTVTPTESTNAYTVADSRYRIAYFDVTTKVYGHDPSGGENLYADSMTVNTFGGSGLRETAQIVNGKSLDVGERVWFSELFTEKVDANGDFASVDVTIYSLNDDGSIDYASASVPDKNSVYEFTENIAVEFTYTDGGDMQTALVYLAEKISPEYTIAGNYTDGKYANGVTADIPDIRYTWGTVSGNFIDNFYLSTEGEVGVNPVSVALYTLTDGGYSLSYFGDNVSTLTIGSDTQIVVYELKNIFGEREYVYLEFVSTGGNEYTITENGEEIETGTIRYDADGERRSVSSDNRFNTPFNDISFITGELSTEYKLSLDGVENDLPLTTVTVYTSTGEHIFTSDYENRLKNLLENSSYATVVFTYGNGFDSYTRYFAYNFFYGGKSELNIFSDEYLFTDYEYVFSVPEVLSADGVSLGGGSIQVRVSDDSAAGNKTYSLSQSDGQCRLTFNQTGVYYITLVAELAYDENGDRVFGGESQTIWATQQVTVKDGRGDVSITFVTDEEHPYAAGIVYDEIVIDGEIYYAYTVTASLTGDIFTLSKAGYFASTSDVLFGWSPRIRGEYTFNDASQIYDSGSILSDFIGSFGTDSIFLYAMWDEGITVHMDMNTEITMQDNYDLSTVYANRTGLYRGRYTISLPSADNVRQPAGWIFVGWTVKETGTLYSAGTSINIREGVAVNGEITIAATFIQEFKVRYQVNSTYGGTIIDGTVTEGDAITQPDVREKAGYTFKEWRIATVVENGKATAISESAFDFSTESSSELVNATINNRDSIVLVAVFEDAEGNLVW